RYPSGAVPSGAGTAPRSRWATRQSQMKQHTSGPCVAHRQRAVTAGCAWLAALVCAVGAPPVQAAPAGPGLAGIGLDTLLDLEVTGASKLALRASESPSAVTVITADEIRALGHRTLADVLRSV